MFSLGRDELTPEEALKREWLVAFGTGGYASSSVIGMNTRKYHGLLVAAIGTPSNRVLLLSKIEDSVVLNGTEHFISTNQYQNATYPMGHAYLERFTFSDHPVFYYSVDGCKIEKEIRAVHGKNAVLITYRVESDKEVELRLVPLINGRSFHSNSGPQEYLFTPYERGLFAEKPYLFSIESDSAKFTERRAYYYNMLYEWEARRKTGELDTQFAPGYFSATLSHGEVNVLASTGKLSIPEAKEGVEKNADRLAELRKGFYSLNGIGREDCCDAMATASDSFLIRSDGMASVIAGYHWFGNWGRDAMVSLPGLCLLTGRAEHARDTLAFFCSHMREGLVPNSFSEAGVPSYNSADASLWFIHACKRYIDATGDMAFFDKTLWPKMQEVVSCYEVGTGGIWTDTDSLLKLNRPGLTWMDTKFTPRTGKPVEVNALWYSSLCIMRELAKQLDDDAEPKYAELADWAGRGFLKYWNPAEKCLFDSIDPYDPSVRPNQVFAISLHYTALDDEGKRRAIFEKVRSELYTPFGLRTLSPRDPRFRGRYAGTQDERDAAYHNGTIWPWLLGAYFDSLRNLNRNSASTVLRLLSPFKSDLQFAGIGSIPEIYESDTMRPEGCISQAWSVAEVLRAYVEAKKEAEQKGNK